MTRFVTLNLHIQHFQLAFGKITFCAKGLFPNFDLKLEKPKDDKKDGGKDAKDGKKKDEKKQSDAKKPEGGKKVKEAAKPVAVVEEEKPKETVDTVKAWEESLPELSFNFFDFKTEFVNSKDKKATL